MPNFFILDCTGQVVGNPGGYRTFRGAIQQQDRRGSPAYRAIWAAFDNREQKERRLICQIICREALEKNKLHALDFPL
jgi:hypothetical protein